MTRLRQPAAGAIGQPRDASSACPYTCQARAARLPSGCCGRFVQLPDIVFGQPGLADLAPGVAEIQPSFNLAPTQCAAVILDRGEGGKVTRMA